jgi:hypothetical protein
MMVNASKESGSQVDTHGNNDQTENQKIDPAAQSEAVAVLKDAVLLALSAEVESLDTSSFHQSANASFAPRSINIDQTVACPDGGSISVVANATVDIEVVQATSISVAADLESGRVTANNCQAQGNVINADVDLKPSFLVGEASLANQALAFSGEGAGGVIGEVDITTSTGQNFQCDFDLDAEAIVDGSVDLTNQSGEVAIEGSLKGEACGNAVDESIDEIITF